MDEFIPNISIDTITYSNLSVWELYIFFFEDCSIVQNDLKDLQHKPYMSKYTALKQRDVLTDFTVLNTESLNSSLRTTVFYIKQVW